MKRLLIGIAALAALVGAGYTTYADGKASGRAELAWASPSDDAPVLLAQVTPDAGAGPGVAAAPLGIEPVHTDTGVAPPAAAAGEVTPPDPVADPGSAWTLTRTMWQRGGWPAVVILLWILAAAYVKRMEPKDGDGDGRPDIKGWRGHSWAIAVALLIVLGPAAAALLEAEGASWAAVPYAVVAAVLAYIRISNPVRGEALIRAAKVEG